MFCLLNMKVFCSTYKDSTFTTILKTLNEYLFVLSCSGVPGHEEELKPVSSEAVLEA